MLRVNPRHLTTIGTTCGLSLAQEQQYPPWAGSYLNYKELKKRIKDILDVRDQPDMGPVLEARKHIFQVGMSTHDCMGQRLPYEERRRRVG